MQGILIDKMCSAKALERRPICSRKRMTKTACCRTPCIKTGYGVYTADGKYLKLDAAGDAKALAAIKASKKKDNFTVKVTGDVEGDSIKVTNLKLL